MTELTPRQINRIALLFVVGGLGCQSAGPPDGSVAAIDSGDDTPAYTPPSKPRVRFDPVDGLSNQGSRIPQIRVVHSYPVADAKAVAATVTLRTWPELAPVATKEVLFAPSKPIGDGYEPGTFAVEAAAALADRWYVVAMEPVPAGWLTPPSSDVVKIGASGMGARFRPGSDPVLWGVLVCPRIDGSAKVAVRFSEPIFPLAKSSPVACDHQEKPCAVSAIPSEKAPYHSITFECPALDATRSVNIAVGAGLTTVSAKSVVASNHSIGLEDLPLDASGCRVFRP